MNQCQMCVYDKASTSAEGHPGRVLLYLLAKHIAHHETENQGCHTTHLIK